MPESTVEEASLASERIRQAVEAHPWSDVAPDLSVTVSIGVADTYHSPGLIHVVDAADRAVHQAKRSGRNRVIAVTTDPGTLDQPNVLMESKTLSTTQQR